MNHKIFVLTLLLFVAVFYLRRTTRQLFVELWRSVAPQAGGSK